MKNLKNTMKQSLRAFSLALFALAFATACTKSKENINKVGANSGTTAVVPKSYFVGKTFHLSRGIEDADSQNDVGATPGMSQDFGLVEARITEKQLQFVSTFDPQGNKNTMKIIASYPITKQFDIVQDKNDFGESTNKTVEDESQDWARRAYMRVDWTKPSTTLSKLSTGLRRTIDTDETVGHPKKSDEGDDSASSDPSEENTVLLESPTYDEGHFNFLVETSVKGLHSGTFVFPQSWTTAQSYRVVYRTHLLEVKASDFKPLPYSLEDFGKFGFFFTQQNFIDPHGILESNQKIYANMHNVCEKGGQGSCATNRIRWVLSNDFPEKYKDVARKVIAKWNETFKADLNRDDDVVYLDESAQATISDPSQNVLAYYPNRTKSGLLGVAQWVSDPRTGEFRGVRATIYGDGIDYVVARVDDLITILAAQANNQDPLAAVFSTTPNGTASGEKAPYSDKYVAKQFTAVQNALGLNRRHAPSSLSMNGKTVSIATAVASAKETVSASPTAANIRLAQFAAASPQTFQVQEMSVIGQTPPDEAFPAAVGGVAIPSLGGLEQSLFMSTKLQTDKAQLLRDAELGIHGTELVEDAALRRLMKYANALTIQELVAKRDAIENEIAVQTFYTTALHEMGHAFGLRHNFAGSADQNHYAKDYYTIKADIEHSNQPTHVLEDLDPFMSSSIMDYGRDFYSQEAGLGPYDKAAIKYAYNRSANRQTDPELNPAQPYMFCTDHQVNESILCRRFDKGANVSEITRNNILYYNTNYVRMHYRAGRLSENVMQGWGSPYPLMRSLIERVFLPTRLVMDEFLYSFIVTESDPTGTGYCGIKFINESLKAGEINNICSRTAMEATHVDPMNPLGTLANALYKYDPQTGQLMHDPVTGAPILLKPSYEYIPNGLADLLFANMEAQTFFATVIGAPEPGSYVAMPTKNANGEQVLKLMPLDDSLPSLDEKVKAFADANGIPPSPEAIAELTALSTKVGVGGYGRQLESVVSINGGFTRTEVIGSWWDKYAALIALSAQGMPVNKYRVAKMGGNAYTFPQTHDFTTAIFGKVISRDNTVTSIPVTIHDPSGQNPNPFEVPALAPAAVNIDLISLSTVFSLTNLVLDTDRSMAEKLRICNLNEAQCSPKPGQLLAQVQSTTNSNVYKALQNADGDSIAYKIVAGAQAIEDQVTKFMKIRDDANNAQPASLMALDNSKDVGDRIAAALAKDDVLAKVKDQKGNQVNWVATVQSVWNDLALVTSNLKTSQRFTAMGIADEAQKRLTQIAQMVDLRINSLGDAGQCWVKDHPIVLSTPVTVPSTIIDLSGVLGHLAPDARGAQGPVKSAVKNASPTPKAPSSLCQDQKAGETLQNLQSLAADLATANSLIKTVVTNDSNAIAAPLQIGLLQKKIHAVETDIQRIRETLRVALPD